MADLGLTQAALAELVGVDQSTVSRWIQGVAIYPRHQEIIRRLMGQPEPPSDLTTPGDLAMAAEADPEDRRALHRAWNQQRQAESLGLPPLYWHIAGQVVMDKHFGDTAAEFRRRREQWHGAEKARQIEATLREHDLWPWPDDE